VYLISLFNFEDLGIGAQHIKQFFADGVYDDTLTKYVKYDKLIIMFNIINKDNPCLQVTHVKEIKQEQEKPEKTHTKSVKKSKKPVPHITSIPLNTMRDYMISSYKIYLLKEELKEVKTIELSKLGNTTPLSILDKQTLGAKSWNWLLNTNIYVRDYLSVNVPNDGSGREQYIHYNDNIQYTPKELLQLKFFTVYDGSIHDFCNIYTLRANDFLLWCQGTSNPTIEFYVDQYLREVS
jgi:hypothetical protein